MEAFDPIYTVIRKSCRGLRSRLPEKLPTNARMVPPPVTQDIIECNVFTLSPAIYRSDYSIAKDFEDTVKSHDRLGQFHEPILPGFNSSGLMPIPMG